MAKNASLGNARNNKEDEFYTQLSDIEKELSHYREHFKGKTVLCNCDDPYESNFFKYFALKFNELGLKKLIATCYRGSPISYTELPLFPELTPEEKEIRPPYKAVISDTSHLGSDGAFDLTDIGKFLQNDKNSCGLLNGDGDFRSAECIELLKQADIVVTNPPFSLFREYVDILMKYEKKFLIIGSQNNITYKEIFKLFKENKIWLGYKAGDMAFKVPEYYTPRETRYWQDENGQKWRSMGNICWYTNLDIAKRHEDLILYKTYSAEEYPKYDNYEIINVNKVSEIPLDYDGLMGVPITFFDKYNPDQFEILGLANSARWLDYEFYTVIENRKIYNRVLIKRK